MLFVLISMRDPEDISSFREISEEELIVSLTIYEPDFSWRFSVFFRTPMANFFSKLVLGSNHLRCYSKLADLI